MIGSKYIFRNTQRPAHDQRYKDALLKLPESGGGGCHAAMLSVANHAKLGGVTPEQCFADLRARIHGKRRVSDKEINDAIAKAYNGGGDHHAHHSLPTPLALDAGKMLRGILAAGDGAAEADLWEASPIRLDWSPKDDAPQLLRMLYAPDDKVFIGGRHDSGAAHVRTVADWLSRFETGAAVPEHIIPNPLRGDPGLTKDGKPSFRADSCVAAFRFAVVEFDSTPESLRDAGATVTAWPLESQAAFWAGALRFNWPIAALIDSGGKSIHCWLAVDAADAEQWTATVEEVLFREYLTPLGVDSTCRNEARLSRMPGHYRREKGRWQRILYFNPFVTGEIAQ
ncbi:MAG: hypothetical protein NTY01_25435 [Verrucomicrobia bacterium]|nr:hypothetical protein [Verrucomicrobiota bacterium]